MLFGAAGVELHESALTLLHARTEGWAAGLRLGRLVAGRAPGPGAVRGRVFWQRAHGRRVSARRGACAPAQEVRVLLLRTSLLERVSGPLAERLTGVSAPSGSCEDPEDAGAFVVSLDGRDRGTATTSCSPTCSRSSCGVPRRANCPPARHRRRVVRRARVPRRRGPSRAGGAGLEPGLLACCRTTGSTLISAGRPPPHANSLPPSQPASPRPMRAHCDDGGGRTGPGDRWRRQNGSLRWPSSGPRRYPQTGADAWRSCLRFCSCTWPCAAWGSVGGS